MLAVLYRWCAKAGRTEQVRDAWRRAAAEILTGVGEVIDEISLAVTDDPLVRDAPADGFRE